MTNHTQAFVNSQHTTRDLPVHRMNAPHCLLPIAAFSLLLSAAQVTAQLTGNESAGQPLVTDVRQLTFEGRRAGEGYFSKDGSEMVFQSERDPKNPFYQIYLMDLETGDIERVSPGTGKTTCAWIHPDGDRVLFASTHDDHQATRKQEDELSLRASGKERRYSWDYDPEYDLWVWHRGTGSYRRLTNAKGYDAEASYSPDGSLIAFASNRRAYKADMTAAEKAKFEIDPSYMMDLYLMNADGSDVRRLTDVAGYDGGPFFSPDGKRICWRRFGEDGATAEIFTMKIDGTDVRRLTELGVMSWAPYYHPSGDYLIFTTNRHGFGNFELYLVRADGGGAPVRVTDSDGFDGLPVFLPSGEKIAWTSNRTPAGRSQIFMAEWNDSLAKQLLKLTDDKDTPGIAPEQTEDLVAAQQSAAATRAAFQPADVGRHVDYLTRKELGGRLTGTPGEKKATAYVAAYLQSLGLLPAGEEGTFFQEFDFPAGSSLGKVNRLLLNDQPLKLEEHWRPLAFSQTGEFDSAEVVFAGYGMVVPAAEDQDEYDSYVHLDVRDKWVMVLRDLPQDITPERRQQLARYSAPQRKAAVARDRGARGIVFVSGPTSPVRRPLIRFDSNASQAGVSIAVTSIDNDTAATIFQMAGKDLEATQKRLDDGSPQMGFLLDDAKLSGQINIQRKTGRGRNVLALLPAGDGPSPDAEMVVLGAHIDHLGRGTGGNSLASENEQEKIHVGADDNASGVAVMLEIAQYLADRKRAGRLDARRDLLIAAWSGEELGLFGSQSFVEHFAAMYPERMANEVQGAASAHGGHAHAHAAAHGSSTDAQSLTGAIAVYLNLDMVGRLRESLVVQGIGSSPGFEAEVQRRNVPVGLSLKLDRTSTRLPTDASAFVARDVPILSAFTGAHEDYHTPRDTADKLNYEGASEIARFFGLLTRGFLVADQAPKFELDEGEQADEMPRANLRAYLGTIPDYVAGDIKGVKLSGVAKGGPADQAGIRGGDVIVKVADKTIENLYDYTYAIEALKIGDPVEIVVRRDEKDVSLNVTPRSRD